MRSHIVRFAGPGILIGLATWVVLSVWCYVDMKASVSTEQQHESLFDSLRYPLMYAVLPVVGYLSGRRGAPPEVAALTGFLTGGVMGALTMGSFLVVDNIRRDILGQQWMQTHVDDGLVRGGAPLSYLLIHDLIPGMFILGATLASVGAAFALGAALVARWRPGALRRAA